MRRDDALARGRRAPLTVVIAGGGTGGHLYPGIAVARELLARVPDARVSFAGTAQGIEARVVPREGFALDLIRSAGLKGKSLAARLRGSRCCRSAGATRGGFCRTGAPMSSSASAGTAPVRSWPWRRSAAYPRCCSSRTPCRA